MGTNDGSTGILQENNNHHKHLHLDSEAVGVDMKASSGPVSKKGSQKSARIHILEGSPGSSSGSVKSYKTDDFADEISLEIGDSSAAVHNVMTAQGADVKDPEVSLLDKGLEKMSRIRQVSEEMKRLTTLSKRKSMGRLDRTKTVASYALKGLKFISKKEEGTTQIALEKRFEDLTKDTNGLLSRSLLWKCIGMNKESKEFAEELFNAVAQRRGWNSDTINKAQLKEFWDEISDQSFDSRLRIFLDMVDKDADGRITKDEVSKIISISASANKLSNIDQYATVIMEELDPNGLGYIMIEKFEELLLQAQTQNARRESEKLRQKQLTMQQGNLIRKWYKHFMYFIQDYWQRCWVIVLWIGVMIGLFTWKYIQLKDRAVYKVLGPCVCIAKGSAETLKLNMALILLPVCRNTITWLRNKTNLGVVVPLDDNISFHQVIAVAILIGVGLHGISHLACDFPRLIHATEEEYKPMQQYFGDQAKNYWHFVKAVVGYTGIIMVVLMMIAFTLATPWLRRGKLKLPSLLKKLTGFNAFWYSHHLFVIVYTLLIVHGINLYLTKEWYKKTTWMYLAVPILLYATERLIRVFRSSVKPVNILRVAVDPGNLVALHMSKPDQSVKYNSGQYIFVNCPSVSPFEWHPFSVTSAPGDDYLSVHIKTYGDWTGKLEKVFKKVCHEPLPNSKSRLLRADFQGEDRNLERPRVLIDGPYGAPAQEYKKYDVVLLVGLGIGATPMISIVKDIVNNMKAKETEEGALENGTTGIDTGILKQQKNKLSGTTSENNFKTTRAYFYWVTGQQSSFDWFKEVMNEAAKMDKNGVIEMHNYCTSVYEEDDARSTLITMLQTLNYAKHGVDVVAGTPVKCHFAKPNWREVYEHIDLKHTGSKIGVFYCGMPAPAKELKHLAHEFSHKTSTRFDFHKENF